MSRPNCLQSVLALVSHGPAAEGIEERHRRGAETGFRAAEASTVRESVLAPVIPRGTEIAGLSLGYALLGHGASAVPAKDSGEGQEPGLSGLSQSGFSGAKPTQLPPEDAKPEGPLIAADPRRLALEDNGPPRHRAAPERRDLGEFDFDI